MSANNSSSKSRLINFNDMLQRRQYGSYTSSAIFLGQKNDSSNIVGQSSSKISLF